MPITCIYNAYNVHITCIYNAYKLLIKRMYNAYNMRVICIPHADNMPNMHINACIYKAHQSCASTRRDHGRSLWLIARGALVCSQCAANSAPLQMIPRHISVT